eukprot:1026766-Prymnesium_polylepis.3
MVCAHRRVQSASTMEIVVTDSESNESAEARGSAHRLSEGCAPLGSVDGVSGRQGGDRVLAAVGSRARHAKPDRSCVDIVDGDVSPRGWEVGLLALGRGSPGPTTAVARLADVDGSRLLAADGSRACYTKAHQSCVEILDVGRSPRGREEGLPARGCGSPGPAPGAARLEDVDGSRLATKEALQLLRCTEQHGTDVSDGARSLEF